MAAWDEGQAAGAGPQPGGASPDPRPPGAGGSGAGASSAAGSEAGGSQAAGSQAAGSLAGGSQASDAAEDADAACWLGSSPSKAGSGAGAALGSSPGKRGGIPLPRNSSGSLQGGAAPALPPVRAQAALLSLAAWQHAPAGHPAGLQPPALHGQVLHGQAGQQPGTPLTPASSSNTPSALGSSFQRSGAGGFLRSVSVDSDNPSLGFGAREALQQLRWVAH